MNATTPAPAEAFKTWLQAAWQAHGDSPAAVLADLHKRAGTVPDNADGADALRLAEHVALAHLGDAAALEALLQQVPAHPSLAPQRQRSQWALDTLAGRPAAGIAPSQRLRGLHSVVMVLVHRGDLASARHNLLAEEAEALRRAADDADALRGYAATAHNTSNDIRGLPREALRDQLMLDAAHLSHRLWTAAGAWQNIERADYQLALCHATLGQGTAALQHAQACLDRCEAQGADATERFFAHEVLARAHHALGDSAAVGHQRRQMQALLPELPDNETRAWCQDTLATVPG